VTAFISGIRYFHCSFWVIHFEVNYSQARNCLSIYNKAALLSKASEEVANVNAENCRCRQAHSSLTDAPSLRPPAHTLYCQKLQLVLLSAWIHTDKSSASGLLSVWIGTVEPRCRIPYYPHSNPNSIHNPKSYLNLK